MTAIICRPGRLFYFLISLCIIACCVAASSAARHTPATPTLSGVGRGVPPSTAAPEPPPAPATTQIADVVYRADGSPAHGMLMITWPAFTTAAGNAVAAGSLNVALGSNGALSLALIANEGATPAGTFYKVLLKLDDGSQNTEYWVVPLHSPTTVAQIRSTVMPATVAAQFASRQYVDAAIAAASGNGNGNNQDSLEGILFADKFSSIQAAITAAGTTQAVLIPPTYTGTDTFTNPNNIAILDMRGGASGAREAFDIREFGAIPNSTFDSQPTIQAAINAASAAVNLAHGGQQEQTVFCPDSGPDLYLINKPLVIHQNWIKFGGDARGACQIFAAFHGPMFALGPLDTRYTAFPATNARSIVVGGNSFPVSATGDGNHNPYWLELADSQAVNLQGLSGFTIDFWFYLTGSVSGSQLFGGFEWADDDSSSNVTTDSFFDANGNLQGRLTVNGTPKQVQIGPAAALTLNAWHHFAMTWDGANLRGFLDGTLGGTTLAAGTITWPTRSSLLFGIGDPQNWPDNGGFNPSPNGNLDALRISNSARWTGNFTPVQAKPTVDAATLLLCNFDNQYDIFTGCSGNDNRTSWLPIHRSTGGSALISNLTLANVTLNGKQQADGIWAYGVTDSKFEGIITSFARRGLTFWGGGTFQNRIYDAYLGVGGGSNSQWCIAGLSGANGVTTLLKPHCLTNAAFPFYWQTGSTVWIHPETSPNQGVATDFYFDGSGSNNMTVTILDGGVDNEVPNTAYVSDLTLKNVQVFTMIGGTLGAGNIAQPLVRISGGGALKFTSSSFLVNPAAPSAVKIVSNPAQPVLFDNTLLTGASIPWCDAAGQCAAVNNSSGNASNLAWAIDRSGRGSFNGVDLSGAGALLNARSGSSTTAATASGTLVSGDCARWDAGGNLTDSGAGCGATPGGANSQVQFNNNGAFGGIANLTSDGTVTTAKAGASFLFADPANPAKKFQFDVSNVSGGTTRSMNVPDAAATFAQPVAATAHNFVTAMSGQGAFSLAQPSFGDLAGFAGCSQMPALSGDTSTVAGSCATTTTKTNGVAFAVSATTDATNAANISSGTLAAARMNPTVAAHTYLGNSAAGASAASFVQPACGDLSNAASSCSTDTTNAANISSGTLGAARLPALSGDVTSAAGSAVTTLGNLPNDVSMAGDILASNTSAPATPAASKTRIYIDATTKVLSSKNDAGAVTHTVSSADCSSTGHVQKINGDGSVACSADGGSTAVATTFFSPLAMSNNSSTGTFAANTVFLYWVYLPYKVTFSNWYVRSNVGDSTSGHLASFGVYSSDGQTLYTSTTPQLFSSSSADFSLSTSNAPVTLNPGAYLVAFTTVSTTGTFGAFGIQSFATRLCKGAGSVSSAGALPSTTTVPSLTNTFQCSTMPSFFWY